MQFVRNREKQLDSSMNGRILFSVDQYQVLKILGQGGMGEVFLAYDTVCKREVAIKRLRQDPIDAERRKQFIQEAQLTSNLNHPAIVPIYALIEKGDALYYVMPFVEGVELKTLLNNAAEQDESCSVQSLMPIFLTVCRAIAYAHSKGVIHRDIKVSNILVGSYGQVRIIDWGLAKFKTVEDEPKQEKMVGTIHFVAPEQIFGKPADYQTEIYSLGLILYQMLTLRFPFHRGDVVEYQQTLDNEVLVDPIRVAPYRSIPPLLSHIARKCLATDLQERYQTVDEVIHDLEVYVERRSDWVKVATPSIADKTIWKVYKEGDWPCMIYKEPIIGRARWDAVVTVEESGKGIGFIIGARQSLNDSYCLFVGTGNECTKLFRFPQEVIKDENIVLKPGVEYLLRVEKVGNNIYFFINDLLQFSYVTYVPQRGVYVGIIMPDMHVRAHLTLFTDFQSHEKDELIVADTLFACHEFERCVERYKQIAHDFPFADAGRKAAFRAAMSLFEEARYFPEEAEQKCVAAIQELNELDATPAAPLQYLGRSSVFHFQKRYEEELIEFEKAFSRFPKHYFLSVFHEALLYSVDRAICYPKKLRYFLAFLAARYLPSDCTSLKLEKLFTQTKECVPPLYPLDEAQDVAYGNYYQRTALAIRLAFCLGKRETLADSIQQLLQVLPSPLLLIEEALLFLIELGDLQEAQKELDVLWQLFLSVQAVACLEWIQEAVTARNPAFSAIKESLWDDLPQCLQTRYARPIFSIFQAALDQSKTQIIYDGVKRVQQHVLLPQHQLQLDSYLVWALLLDRQWSAAEAIFAKYAGQELLDTTKPICFLYGCWLAQTSAPKAAYAHFSQLSFKDPPSIASIGAYFLLHSDVKPTWEKEAFTWEKQWLARESMLLKALTLK